jgi:hypothetical protein
MRPGKRERAELRDAAERRRDLRGHEDYTVPRDKSSGTLRSRNLVAIGRLSDIRVMGATGWKGNTSSGIRTRSEARPIWRSPTDWWRKE